MGVTVYRSSDSGAPTLQGIVGGAYASGWADGSLLELLRKCLVVGYGSKSAAGWTLSYTGTSKGAFRQGAGCQFYLRVLDDGSPTAGAREASLSCFEVMTDVDTGTGQFPAAGTGLFVRKSNSADTALNNWILVADNRTFYLFVDQVGLGTRYLCGTMFGDIKSLYSGDAYNCMVIARSASAIIDAGGNEKLDLTNVGSSRSTYGAIAGHSLARLYTQSGGQVTAAKIGGMIMDGASGTQAFGSGTGLGYPNAPDMKLPVSRVYVCEPGQYLRGWLRGLWAPEGRPPLGETIAGSGDLAGRTMACLGLGTGNSAVNGRYLVETSDTWD